jgi:hypothetical protein
VVLMRLLGWSWRELCATPAPAVAVLARIVAAELREQADAAADADADDAVEIG